MRGPGEAGPGCAESKVLEEAGGNMGLGVAGAERVRRNSSMDGAEGRSLPSPCAATESDTPALSSQPQQNEAVLPGGQRAGVNPGSPSNSLCNLGPAASPVCLSFLVCRMQTLLGPTS